MTGQPNGKRLLEGMTTSPRSVRDYQLGQPDYLNSILPREYNGWHRFSADSQADFKMRERMRLVSEGYSENLNGSFSKL